MEMNEGRASRRVTFINAKLRAGDDWRDVQIRNVSETGLLVRVSEPPDVGQAVELRHRGWCTTGEVIWRTQSRMGVQTHEAIDLSGLLADSGIGRSGSEAVHDMPHPSFWKRLRGRAG